MNHSNLNIFMPRSIDHEVTIKVASCIFMLVTCEGVFFTVVGQFRV